ncbi:MAG: amino acid adenylation domain-containing protein [Methylobacter sp.]
MSLLGPSMESPEPFEKIVAEQFPEWVEMKPEITASMEQLLSCRKSRLLEYWKLRIKDAPALELPTDRPRPAVQSYRGESRQFSLPLALSERLEALSLREGVVLFMTLTAAFQLLLHRYSGQDDIVIGTPTTGQNRLKAESSSGFFVNPLVLRTDLSGNPSFQELLMRVREVIVEAYANKDIPFERLVEALYLQHDLSLNPLVQVMFVFHDSLDRKLRTGNITGEIPQFNTGATQFDLTLELSETANGLIGKVTYATDLFEVSTIDRLIGHFQTLLENIIARPEARLSELPLLSELERRQLLVEWNNSSASFPREKCIHELFEAQAAATPEAVAVVHEGSRLSYAELNAQANQLAHFLRELGVKPDTRVAICVERSLNMAVGLLAILKAGGAYVPLDPAYPKERLAFMIKDSAPQALLTQSRFEKLFADIAKTLPIVDLDADYFPWANRPDSNTDHHEYGLAPNHLAYIVYTSGSTGKPKGVMIEHKSLCNMAEDVKQRHRINGRDRFLQFVAIAFDAFAQDFFGALVSGAALVLRSDDWLCDASKFWSLCENNQVSIVTLPTLFWRQLAQANQVPIPCTIRQIIVGGEAISSKVLVDWFERESYRPKLFNAYGPTETTVNATVHLASPDSLSLQSIGRPVSNTSIYILDPNRQPVPIGVTGEMYIGGVGVARGYLNHPELTAERFVSDPFATKTDARMYKTGDLARWLADGTIEFLGRNDFQVKIRGFRIELGDIETELAGHPAVRDVAVLAHEDRDEAKRLVAYLVPEDNFRPDVAELRGFLKNKIPEFMIPSTFVFLDTLPASPNGKLDRKALPMPDISQQAQNEDFIAPHSPMEELLAGIWSEILSLDRIGVHDNFFELGGHSMLAVQMLTRVRMTFGVELDLRQIFEFPTVAGLAREIEQANPVNAQRPPIIPVTRDNDLPLSFTQERFWIVSQLDPQNPVCNCKKITRILGLLDVEILEQCVAAVVARHEVLRTNFLLREERLVQVIAESLPTPFRVVDLAGFPEAEREARADLLIQEEAKRPYDLTRDPLLRVLLLRLGPREHDFVLTIHHTVWDAWAAGVLHREIAILYRALKAGESSPLPPLAVQYADFAIWERQWMQSGGFDSELSYWRNRLQGLSTLHLPTDHARPHIQNFTVARQTFKLSSGLSGALMSLSQREGATLFMTIVAAFQTLLHRYSGQDDIAVGSPVCTNSRVETEPLMGCFLNTLVLRTDCSGAPSFQELLGRVREVTLGALAHQELPFDKLVESLNPKRDLSRHPLVQVMVNMHVFRDENLELPDPELKLIPMDDFDVGSMFDLTLVYNRTSDGRLDFILEYSPDLFNPETISRMIGHFQTLLEAIVESPATAITELALLTAPERHQLLVEWNATKTDYPKNKTITQLFEEQAAKTPDAIALVFGQQQLSYQALNVKANQLACYLKAGGIKPDSLIAICMERSIELVIGLLAVLKAGGAYVPLDPGYPKDRLEFMLEDSEPVLLLSQSKLESLFSGVAKSLPIINLDAGFSPWASHQDINPDFNSVGRPENLAYVIYTSGSTGKPKGVMVEHRNVVNFLNAMTKTPGMTCSDTLLAITTVSFDIAGLELFLPLINGARIVLISHANAADAAFLQETIDQSGITLLQATPATWRLLLNGGWQGSTGLKALCGGEALTTDLSEQLVGSVGELWNLYGPTETTIWSTCRFIHDSRGELYSFESIGKPIDNTQIYILDAQLQPVPQGIPGEIYIGGAGVTRGYLNRPEMTAERFVPDPFSDQVGARMYKTGDLACRLADGSIDYLGRNDFQVKIRGFRIEIGEIEITLRQHPQLREVAVGVYEPAPGDKRLAAYLVADNELAPSELRDFLKPKLPEFMLPSAFVFLDALPLTPNGKLDRKALPEPDQSLQASDAEFTPPRNSMEQQLAEIWAEILKIDRIGVHDNFFALGGHSLLAVKVIAEINKRLNMDLALSVIYQSPTIEELAIIISSGNPQLSWYSLVPIQTQGSRPPLFAIHTITLLDLPRHLGKDQPLYFLRYGMAAELNNSSVSLPLLEKLAGHYIEEMRRVQPHGPYYLVGFSFGGVIAYEMAHQLLANGYQVNLVGLLDTYLTEEKQLLPLHRIIYNFFKQSPSELLAMVKNKIVDLITPNKYGTDFWPHVYTEAPDMACRNNYQPKTYDGRITLFQGSTVESRLFSYALPEHAWAELIGDRLDVQQISGNHFNIFQEPHSKVLAEKIIVCMDNAINDGRTLYRTENNKNEYKKKTLIAKEPSVKVSIIIPAFNAGAYIRQTLESVINQTEQDLEIIVSDDFSTDNTVAVVEDMMKSDYRIRLIKNEQNRGPSYSRNRAISKANGEWIALLDADDFYHEDRLKELITIAEKHEADVVADNMYYVNENGENPRIALENKSVANKYEILSTNYFIKNNLPVGSNFKYGFLQPIMRRNFLYKNSIAYDETTRLGEDFILYIECLLNGAKFIFSYDAFYYYRSSSNSITHTYGEGALLELKDNNAKLIKIAQQKNNKDATRLLKYRQRLFSHAILYSEVSKKLKNYQFVSPFRKVIMHPESWLFFYMMTLKYIKKNINKLI